MFWYKDIGFRPVERHDLEDIRKLRNNPTTWVYLSDVTQISPSMQDKWFTRISEQSDGIYFTVCLTKWKLQELVEGKFIGIIRIDEYDATNRTARIGCDIVPGHRGKGYGTQVYKAIFKYYFDHIGLHRLWLCVLENNEVAIKLYKNVGFKEEGRLREAIWRDGKRLDYIVMSILEHEYRNK